MLQSDDVIVTESQCWNFESGSQGFIEAPIADQYTCGAGDCGVQTNVNTVAAPWSNGPGCGSESRSDDPQITCDVAGTGAFKTNSNPAACNSFPQSRSGGVGTIVDDVLYSPIFGPAHTGLAANGQPWSYEWQFARWYYRSDMATPPPLREPALGVGFLWDRNYPGNATPAVNEIYDYYPYLYGYFYYANQDWDSATPWDPLNSPANLDTVAFSGAAGAATPGLKWRWAVEVFDADLGEDPLNTAATRGLALDNLNLTYAQYHADAQIGSCVDPPATATCNAPAISSASACSTAAPAERSRSRSPRMRPGTARRSRSTAPGRASRRPCPIPPAEGRRPTTGRCSSLPEIRCA
jgi:hypothetical protein